MDYGIIEKYQVLQTQAREEVLQVFGNGEPDFDGLNCLQVVTMTLYESLLQYPPLTTLIRDVNEDIVLGELSLPSGTLISLPVILLHHDKEIWGEDASKFNPERFIKVSASAMCLIRDLNGQKMFGFLLVDILGINSY
ncbi:hypothetical protein FXO38_23294 [Capsicum annuum]|nr:hypothetical protein FXO38_23294 [Capsicum annuum]